MDNEIYNIMVYGDKTQLVLARGTYRGIDYAVLNCRGMHPCGYVNVKGTKYNGVNYNDIRTIECHGGLTYSESFLVDGFEGGWWIGWDYGHWNDYVYYSSDHIVDGRQYTTQDVIVECKNVIDQILG